MTSVCQIYWAEHVLFSNPFIGIYTRRMCRHDVIYKMHARMFIAAKKTVTALKSVNK